MCDLNNTACCNISVTISPHKPSYFIGNPTSSIEGGEEQNYTLGLRWWVNDWVNFAFNYIHADVDKQTTTNSGVQEGQEFDIFAFRTAVKW